MILIVLIAAKKFKGNYYSALDFLGLYERFYRLDKGILLMRLHCLKPIIELIYKHLCHTTKLLNASKNYIIDIFLVSVYRNIRIKIVVYSLVNTFEGSTIV